MTALCIIMGGACLLYYLIMFFYIGRIGDFAWFWLLNAAVFLSAAWLRSLTQSVISDQCQPSCLLPCCRLVELSCEFSCQSILLSGHTKAPRVHLHWAP